MALPTATNAQYSPAGPYVFYFGPFRLESELDVPELRTSTGPGNRAVTLRVGGVPQSLECAVPAGTFAEVAPDEFLLTVRGTARYYVAAGKEVRVEPEPGVPIANVSAYLLGSVFGALCHQNGLVPLHASAVESQSSGDAEPSVTAFLGESGAGKSTLAACLQQRSYPIVSDDICLIDPAPDPPQVIPVAGWLKLWTESFEHIGETPEQEHRVFSTDDKYRLFLPPSGSGPRTLRRVILLERSSNSEAQPILEPLATPDAIAALMDQTYVAYIPALMGQQARIFRQCAAVFRHAQAFRLTRPWSLDRTDAVLDLLERELLRPDKQHR
jgi:hypothetical protein